MFRSSFRLVCLAVSLSAVSAALGEEWTVEPAVPAVQLPSDATVSFCNYDYYYESYWCNYQEPSQAPQTAIYNAALKAWSLTVNAAGGTIGCGRGTDGAFWATRDEGEGGRALMYSTDGGMTWNDAPGTQFYENGSPGGVSPSGHVAGRNDGVYGGSYEDMGEYWFFYNSAPVEDGTGGYSGAYGGYANDAQQRAYNGYNVDASFNVTNVGGFIVNPDGTVNPFNFAPGLNSVIINGLAGNGAAVGQAGKWDTSTEALDDTEPVLRDPVSGITLILKTDGAGGAAMSLDPATGRVVGQVGDPYAAIWTPNGSGGYDLQDLNGLIPSGSGWHLDAADQILPDGRILGVGELGGRSLPFVLTPVPEPAGLVPLALGALALLRRRSQAKKDSTG